MTVRYIYTDKIGPGPDHPAKRWGLFSTELTPEQAAERYALDAARRQDWFGVVRLEEGQQRPNAYLQVCPQANGIVLHRLNEYGSVTASYTWGAYHEPTDDAPFAGTADRVFLSQIVGYVYPDGDRYLDRIETLGTMSMEFTPTGYGKEERTIKRGHAQPDEVETREFRGVDVSANWFDVPAFGEWERFFHPTPDE